MEGFVGVPESLREITLLDSLVGPERAFQVQPSSWRRNSSLCSRSSSMPWSISSSTRVSAPTFVRASAEGFD
jgi:hypothetical protein